MFPFQYPVPQTDPPLSPRETLPTMYDLKSEDPEEPGLPDEFHDWQAQLLSLTFRPPHYPPQQVFYASDMNLYYDVRHPGWYKRPDWFGVVGVPRLYEQVDMRLSYVVWQEGVNPYVVVELLSLGTEKEDLGETEAEALPVESREGIGNGQVIEPQVEHKPPRKWQVYERILRIPYYAVFSRYTNQLRVFTLAGGHYQELELQESRVWIPELDLGLGLWQGEFQGIERLWLRWYDAQGNWILTETEQERQRAETAETQLQSLLERLRESGIDPNTLLGG
ncbi:MAG: Uma2 family endonuclease [Coleofasciculus sp. D1-CHI-01]|uniref:Uma2 family endonuclease n=1 Tax=Coleofasciculus sp. D1-CHI-01 TaxID=3068482 RepID=UPI00330509F3